MWSFVYFFTCFIETSGICSLCHHLLTNVVVNVPISPYVFYILIKLENSCVQKEEQGRQVLWISEHFSGQDMLENVKLKVFTN